MVRLATQRIEELSGKEKAITAEIAALEAAVPDEPRRAEIEGIISGLPDMREVMEEAEPEGLIELFGALDLEVTYDKPAQTLELSVLLTSDLPATLGNPDAVRPPGGRSYQSDIAWAGYLRICATSYRRRRLRPIGCLMRDRRPTLSGSARSGATKW